MGTTTKFFGEDVSWGQFTGDTVNGKFFEYDTFSDSVFTEVDILHAFGGRQLAPVGTFLVVVRYFWLDHLFRRVLSHRIGDARKECR